MKTVAGAPFGGHLFLGAILAFIPSPAPAGEVGYVRIEALGRSEPNAIMDALDGWHGPHGPGRAQYAWSWMEGGVRLGPWGIGAVYRMDYDLRFTADSADLYGAIQNDESLVSGRTYQVSVEAHVVHARGLRVAYQATSGPDFRAEIGLSLLASSYLMEGSLRGFALATGPRAYTYRASVDYGYAEDVLFDRPVPKQAGRGAALDAAVAWRFLPSWRMDLRLRDLPGFLAWRDLPYTQAGASSDRTHTDDKGFTHWDPLVSGVEANHGHFTQRLPPRGSLELAYEGWRVTPAAGLNYQFGDWLPRVGMGRPLGPGSLMAWFWPRDHAFGLEYRSPGWTLGLSMDHLQAARVQMVNARFSLSF